MKVVSVVGARPEFVQTAVLSKEIRRYHTEFLVHTGQHYDNAMSRIFFRDLELDPPDCNLGVGSASHGEQTGEVLARFERVLFEQEPDWVIVRGDTNSTIGAALASAKLGIPVAHVEAGMRSYDRQMPEEINRVVTDHVSSLLFCATQTAVCNLLREGISTGVHCVGDVMLDTLLHFSEVADARSRILDELDLAPGSFLLLTVHRAANTDRPNNLAEIIAAINQLDQNTIFPVHPRTRRAMIENGLETKDRIRLIDPVGYLDMLALEKNASKILTDSGGVQREAFYLGVPCITLRDETEWVETVAEGWNVLAGANHEKIIDAVMHFNPPAANMPGKFGDGRASEKIVKVLTDRGAT